MSAEELPQKPGLLFQGYVDGDKNKPLYLTEGGEPVIPEETTINIAESSERVMSEDEKMFYQYESRIRQFVGKSRIFPDTHEHFVIEKLEFDRQKDEAVFTLKMESGARKTMTATELSNRLALDDTRI